MGQQLVTHELGDKLTNPNSDVGVARLFGPGAPGGDTGFQDAAEVGSIYQQTDGNGDVYKKKTAGAGADKWIRLASTDDLLAIPFRDEKVIAATGEALSNGVRNLTTTPFTDDEGTTLTSADFQVGEYVIGGVGGTVKLFEVTAVSAPNITLTEETTNPLTDQDKFIVKYYLPDSPNSQEKQALVHYDGTTLIKLGDVNWDFADGINLESSYTPGSGDITNADTVQSAIQKLDGNNDAQDSALGIAQGDTNLGSYTGPQSHLTNNGTAKQGIQENANKIRNLEGQTSEDNITTERVIDSVLVDDYRSILWQVDITLASDESRVRSFLLRAMHDGKGTADAANTAEDVTSKLNLGASFNRVVTIGFSGAAGTQKMELKVSASAAVNVRAQRVSQVEI